MATTGPYTGLVPYRFTYRTVAPRPLAGNLGRLESLTSSMEKGCGVCTSLYSSTNAEIAGSETHC